MRQLLNSPDWKLAGRREREQYQKESFSILCFAELIFVIGAQTRRDGALNPTQFQKSSCFVFLRLQSYKMPLTIFNLW